MSAGLVYILLCVTASVVIAHLFKVTEAKKLNTVRVLTVNYLVAFLSALFLFEGQERTSYFDTAMLAPLFLGIVVGGVFILNFLIYSKSVFHNGMGISLAAMRISLIVPVLLSIQWYGELITPTQWIGVILVFAVLFLLLPDKRSLLNEPWSMGWLLVVLFVLTGIGDAGLKVYEVDYAHLLTKGEFMFIVFLTAFLIGLSVVAWRRNWKFTSQEILTGIGIGVPNLLASIFLLEALDRLNGAVVYSIVNVLTVVGGTLVGIFIWKDKFTPLQWCGLILTLVSLLLIF